MKILGLDIGGTKSKVILAELNSDNIEFIFQKEILTIGSWQEVMEKLFRICENVLQEYAIDKQDVKIGISCGGPLNTKTGEILNPPNLPNWHFNIIELVEKRLNISASLMNDADACAVAEWKYGAGKGCSNVVFLTFGTGLGAGLILDGRLYRGSNGNAGEVGHIRLEKDGPVGYGKKGSFEGFCSGGGIRQLAIAKALELEKQGIKASYIMSSIDQITTKDVSLACEKGYLDALEVMALSGEYFGRGLAVIIDILNPEIIIAGSVFARAGKFMVESMEKELKKEALPVSRKVCSIVPAMLGEKIGDYGAVVASFNL